MAIGTHRSIEPATPPPSTLEPSPRGHSRRDSSRVAVVLRAAAVGASPRFPASPFQLILVDVVHDDGDSNGGGDGGSSVVLPWFFELLS